jgi:hypothetical protein
LRLRGHDSTVFDAEAQARRELAEVGFTEIEIRGAEEGVGVRGDAGGEII